MVKAMHLAALVTKVVIFYNDDGVLKNIKENTHHGPIYKIIIFF